MKYYVDAINGVVVAKMSEKCDPQGRSPRRHAIDYIVGKLSRRLSGLTNMNRIDARWYLNDIVERCVEKYVHEEDYNGVARCSPEDKFDEEKGKILARGRCLRSYYADVADAANAVTNTLALLSETSDNTTAKAWDSAMYWNDVVNKM